LEIDLAELRQRYADLSDGGLLSIDRSDLTELARQYYDAEVCGRGLQNDPAITAEETTEGEKLVPVATFVSFEEANLGRALLESADIPATFENELSPTWTGVGGLRLMVPASFLDQAEEILEAQISDEELLAQAEAAESVEGDQAEDLD
jgi:Putative prokaryotic signal transducing protein